jgi:deoxycytidine triphosphate deaminase
MLASPKQAVDDNWVTHPDCKQYSEWVDRNFISPNAIDFTIDKLFAVDNTTVAVLSETEKKMRKVTEVAVDSDGYWTLEPNVVYDGMSAFFVSVPKQHAAQLIIRSTFNRVGCRMSSGLYDDSFSGNIGFTLINHSGQLKVKPGTRIGQIMFIESNSVGAYKGGYNSTADTHWTETSKS